MSPGEGRGPVLSEKANRWIPRGLALFALVAAAIVYQPWRFDPFPLRDFGRLLSLLAPTQGFGQALDALFGFFAKEGRFQPIYLLTIVAQWKLFGLNIVAWQLLRFALMGLVLSFTVLVARRCGAAAWPAVVGAACAIVFASGTHESWFLLQVAEPLATLFFLGAMLLALAWSDANRRWLVAIALAVPMVGAVLTKETMIAAVPFLLGVMVCHNRGSWEWPTVNRRALLSIAIVVGTVGLCAVLPIALLRFSIDGASYASRFSLSDIDGARLWNTARAILLPVTRVPWFPANIFFLGVLLVGWGILIRANPITGGIRALVLLSLPTAGALLYSAWPAFPGYYATPFMPAVGIALALALTAIASSPRPALRVGCYLAVAGLAVYGLMLSANSAAHDRAIRRIDFASVGLASELPVTSALVVGVIDPLQSGAMAVSIGLYAAAIGRAAPSSTRDVTCAEARELARAASDSTSVMLFSYSCPDLFTPDVGPVTHRTSAFTQADWKTFRVRRETLTVSLRPADRASQ